MFTAIALATNPTFKRFIPLIGEIGSAFGVEGVGEDRASAIVATVRKYLPLITNLRNTSIANINVHDVCKMLNAIGVNMTPDDLNLWVTEIDKFSNDSNQSIQSFLMSEQAVNMLKGVLTKSTKDAVDVPVDDIPAYDPISGTFVFN